MPNITNDSLTRSATKCFIGSYRPTHVATVGVKGLKVYCLLKIMVSLYFLRFHKNQNIVDLLQDGYTTSSANTQAHSTCQERRLLLARCWCCCHGDGIRWRHRISRLSPLSKSC